MNPEGADLQSAAVAAVPHPQSLSNSQTCSVLRCLVFEQMNTKTGWGIVSTNHFQYTRPGVSLCRSDAIIISKFPACNSKRPGSAKGTGPSHSMEPATGIAASFRSLHPLRGFAPCELRWKTHPRFLSFAPVSGFDSRRAIAKGPDPPREPGLHTLWSQRQESNPQPTDYKSVALPLSHAGTHDAHARKACLG